jgi:hypothetical protein
VRIHARIEQVPECPEDIAMSNWLEETSVYVSVAAVDEGDVEDPPAES